MSIIGALPFNLTNGTTADATQVMANFDEILNDTNNNAAHNGVNNDITALSALTTPITPAQGGTTIWYGLGAGTGNVQTVPTPTPSGFTNTPGYTIFWVPSAGNTGATTLNVNSAGAEAVRVQTGAGLGACVGGELIAGVLAKATLDASGFWVLDADPMASFGPVNNLASGTTTDIGTALSHTVNITGTTTITSFGSSASFARPLYKLVFSGTLLLTYNATSLILPGSGNITTANGDSADALYLGSGNWQIIAYYKRTGQPVAFNPVFIQNYISGLTLSTAGGSGTFGVVSGVATDSTNAITMLLVSAFTKTTASWAVGSGNGGLDTGAIANTTWYHVFLIQRPDTGVVDVLFSLSATSPTLPTNYVSFRRIGSMKTDGSAHWLKFSQTANLFLWDVPVTDLSVATGAAAANLTLSVAPVVVQALYNVQVNIGGAGSMQSTWYCPTPGTAPTTANLIGQTSQLNFAQFITLTNASGQVRHFENNTNGTVTVQTLGWYDFRGTT